MTSAVLVGSTGQVGSNILTTLAAHPEISHLHAYARRQLPTSSPKIHPLISADPSTWQSQCPQNTSLFLSALATTRTAAGSFAAQRKTDYDLNLSLAKVARQAGATTYVLISAAGANSSSWFAYMRMKGELEDAVTSLGFEHTVILRPGFIVGPREKPDVAELVLRKVAGVAGAVYSPWLKDAWAQDASVIARAAVNAGVQCVQGKVDRKVWVLSQPDIVRLGRTEWTDSA